MKIEYVRAAVTAIRVARSRDVRPKIGESPRANNGPRKGMASVKYLGPYPWPPHHMLNFEYVRRIARAARLAYRARRTASARLNGPGTLSELSGDRHARVAP